MLNLVTVQARTRGKSPQMFSYQGVGRLTEREVLGKDGETIKDAEGNPVKVHDIDASGVTDDVNEVLNLFGTIPARKIKDAEGNEVDDPKDTPLQRVIDGALNWFNVLARKAASPVSEAAPSEDELTPIVAELIAAGILTEDTSAVWRRTVTTGAKSVEMERIDFAKMTKEYKKLAASK